MALFATNLVRPLALIALLFAFLTLGFAHKNIPSQMTPELAAYVAAGGSLFDLCGTDQLPEDGQTVECEACRIADSFALLRGCKQVMPVELERVEAWRFVAKTLAESQGLDPARLTRAPPYV